MHATAQGAAKLFNIAVRLGSRNLQTHFALSALQTAAGRPQDGRATLERALAHRPYTIRSRTQHPTARVLRTQGVDESYFLVGRRRSGERKVKIRGGNITDQYLIDTKAF